MKIIELTSENFKRLNVNVVLDGKGVTIEGKNGVGKSTFIDAVWIALTGCDIPEAPIKTGEDSAKLEVMVKADDETVFIVERKFNKNGTTLTVKTKDGAKYNSPQRFLDERLGNISFDPFEFVNKPPREQKVFLMKLLNLDFTEIDAKKKYCLAELHEKRTQYKDLEAVIAQLPDLTGYDEEKSAAAAYAVFNDKIKQRDIISARIASLNSLIADKEKSTALIAEMEARIDAEREKIETNNIAINKLREFDLTLPEMGDIEKEIACIDEHNRNVKIQKIKHEKVNRLSELGKEGIDLKAAISNIEAEKIKMIAKAKMPLDGLTFSDDGLLYEGLPISEEQLSKAKLIELGIKISMALNPALRIMRIKDGSLLDTDTVNLIKTAAKDNDYQLFIERVSDAAEIGFIIEE